jgi:glycosyltransferase involved in cell wall biosynthesis
MRVVHLTTVGGATGGGAWRAAYRVHQGVENLGVESTMLCLMRSADDRGVIALTDTVWGAARRAVSPFVERLQVQATRAPAKYPWSAGMAGLFRVGHHASVQAADVITLYFVNGGFLSIPAIGEILSLGKPVVWRLSDMWPFTGGCHYSFTCNRYRESCGKCPQLASNRELDWSRLIWLQKRNCWNLRNLTVVTPSRWMAGEVQASRMFAGVRSRVIPTGIDARVFRPIEKSVARQILGLPLDRKLVLSAGLKDARKGGTLIIETMKRLFQLDQGVHFATLQQDAPVDLEAQRTHALGRLNDPLTLALAYSAADVFLAPSQQDNLPNTVLESLGCGTPVVALDVAGVRDVVIPSSTGLLSPVDSPLELVENLTRLLNNDEERHQMGLSARRLIENGFTQERQAEAYKSLYAELVGSTAGALT